MRSESQQHRPAAICPAPSARTPRPSPSAIRHRQARIRPLRPAHGYDRSYRARTRPSSQASGTPGSHGRARNSRGRRLRPPIAAEPDRACPAMPHAGDSAIRARAALCGSEARGACFSPGPRPCCGGGWRCRERQPTFRSASLWISERTCGSISCATSAKTGTATELPNCL